MVFTKTGFFVATLALIFGVLSIAMGVIVASGFGGPEAPARYFGSGLTGAAIDQGIYTILIALFLGVLTEISKSLIRPE